MPMEIETLAQTFSAAKQAADEAKAPLIARLAAIPTERKEALAKWKAEMHEIRQLLGRTRKANGVKTSRKPYTRKAKAGIEKKEQA